MLAGLGCRGALHLISGGAAPCCTLRLLARLTRHARLLSACLQGNSRGDCCVFDSESGERVGHVAAARISGGAGSGFAQQGQNGRHRSGFVLVLRKQRQRMCVPCLCWSMGVAHLLHPACRPCAAPVRACGLSEDCRHLLAVLGKGFIFRWAACFGMQLRM